MKGKKVGVFSATALVVANMIGTGVFTSLGFQVGPLPSAPVLLFLWICGGLVALCGGLSYIKLASKFPGTGGEYHYIRESYNAHIASLAGFVSVFAGFAAPVALASMACSAYFSIYFTALPQKLFAAFIVSGITAFHCFNLTLGSRFQIISTSLKVILIIIFIIFGLFTPENANSFELNFKQTDLLASSGFATSLVYVSFAYSGWNASVYIFSEIKNPEVNIKRSIIGGTLLVTLLYTLLNFVFLKTVAIKNLEGIIEVGTASANMIFGHSGGKIISMTIGLLLISAISAMVWIGSRVIVKMAAKNAIHFISDTNAAGIPLKALGLQYFITLILILTGTFVQILTYTGVVLSISSCLAVSVLFRNIKISDLRFLIAPILYILITSFSIVLLLFG
jgi:APA family basic amino acid/polyamine antiporter